MTYNDILLASDGSDASDAAVEHALQLAEALDATLHVVYVLDLGEGPSIEADSAEHPDLAAKRQHALDHPANQAARKDIPVTTSALRGPTSESITEYAGEHDIDLIVMGTHGRSGLDRLLLGSVAEQVVRTAPVPVVTVQPD